MKRKRKQHRSAMIVVLALLLCLQSLCAFAEGDGREDGGEVPVFLGEEEAEPEELVVEEQEPEPTVEEVVEEADAVSDEAGCTVFSEEAEPEATENGEDGELITLDESVNTETETLSGSGSADDNDALFQAYFESLLRPRLRRPVGPTNLLEENDINIYYILAGHVTTVAQEGGSAVFEITLDELGITNRTWTKDDLGVEAVFEKDPDTGKYHVTEEAHAAIMERLNVGNLDLIVHALMQDYPYHMYWYDKTKEPASRKVVSYTPRGNVKTQTITADNARLTFLFEVADDYGTDQQYEVDSVKVGRAQTAAANARAIVDQYAAVGDMEKLRTYKNEICSLTSYNYEAAAGGISYGDPWQVIYVFDGDPDTKVVCEGYAKAFEYLCDMSSFTSSAISCISVTGTTSGKHMWNIVTLEPGKNVLADVTNCDTGMIGADDLLFLVGYAEGSVAESYRFACNSSTITYVYDQNTRELMTEEQLTLVPAVEPPVATAVGTALNVLGEIGVVYYMDIPEELMDGIYAELTIGDKIVPVPKADFKKSGSNYIFSISLPAAEDQTKVSLKLVNKDGVVTMTGDRVENNIYTDSIYGYLKRQEGKEGSFAALARAMRNYCEYARKNFGNDPGIAPDLDPITLNRDLLTPFILAEGSLPAGISFAGLQLNLEAATSLRIVFTLAGGRSIGDYAFRIDDKDATASLLSGSMYYVEVPNIPAAELDLAHTVSINGTQVVRNVSALSYAYRGLGNASYTQNLKETLMALYYYNQAANQYFG